MARLNEPPISTDSMETLRRKFLRQNRDIARVNSTQSLKIRLLENEVARLLSENLDLRGQILRMEKEAEDSSAQRIADHALEIKARMEAQLIEWGSMLASLGMEPPSKRQSPMSRRMAKPRSTLSRSPAQRRPRDSAKDPAGLALEGRLPPIHENKTYPRQTLNREEILALAAENAELIDSPDLGPPPVSRFVDEEPVKVDSPCRTVSDAKAAPKVEEVTDASSPERLPPPKLEVPRKPVAEPEKRRVVLENKPSKPIQPQSAPQPARTGAKRKFATSDEPRQVGSARSEDENCNEATEKAVPIRDLKNRRSYKDLPLHRKESREKLGAKTNPPLERKPLAAKSTNEDVSSPKKVAKTKASSERVAGSLDGYKSDLLKDRIKEAKRAMASPTPDQPQSTIVAIGGQERPTSLIDAHILVPDTPDRGGTPGRAHDTPPPADISSLGETTRGSRRARSAVSYAEPNLRDKMRRPTKELLDAVSGEGKFGHRGYRSEDKTSGALETPSETPAGQRDARVDHRIASAVEALAADSVGGASMLSPLGQKEAPIVDTLSSTGITARRKRPSSIGVRESIGSAVDSLQIMDQGVRGESVEVGRKRGLDPYEFTTSSPKSDVTGSPDEPKEELTTARGSRMSRRSSGALQSRSYDKLTKHTNSRKRASMAAPKKASMLEAGESDDDNDDSYEPSGTEGKGDVGSGGGLTTRDRISRRRSMML